MAIVKHLLSVVSLFFVKILYNSNCYNLDDMKTKKDPLAPISLRGEEARWFVNYLEGKVKLNPDIEKRRRELLKEAELIESKNSNEICIRI